MNPQASELDQSRRIVLTVDDLAQLSIAWLAQGRPAPTPEQMKRLVEEKVRQEVLYREAIAAGLDKDDEIIKRRLAQKLEFLAEDMSRLKEPSSPELESWYKANLGHFALPARVSFRHIYFSSDRHGKPPREAATAALATLAASGLDAAEATTLGDAFMFRDTYGDYTPSQVATEFGPQFAKSVFALEPGAWRGPIESGYGWHLIWVVSKTDPRVPPLEEIGPAVKSDWITDQRERAKRKMFATMRARYEIVLPDGITPPVTGKLSSAEPGGAQSQKR
jgi:hypothetical protein